MRTERHRGLGRSGWFGQDRRGPADPAAPLCELVARKAPPQGLLLRIEAEVDALETARRAARIRRQSRWQLAAAALGGGAAAALLCAVLFLGALEPPARPLVLTDVSGAPVLKLEAGSNTLRLGPPAIRPEEALELWLLPGGTGSPVSLGLLAATGDVTLLPVDAPLLPGDVLALSEEPHRGSPAPGPTGPVIASVTVP